MTAESPDEFARGRALADSLRPVADDQQIDCPERCVIPPGVELVEVPPTRHAWPDVVRCPNEGCERFFLLTKVPADG